jgi:hypothetical protein
LATARQGSPSRQATKAGASRPERNTSAPAGPIRLRHLKATPHRASYPCTKGGPFCTPIGGPDWTPIDTISSFSIICLPTRSPVPGPPLRLQAQACCSCRHTNPTSTQSNRPSPRSKPSCARRPHELLRPSKPPSPPLSKRSPQTNAPTTLQTPAMSQIDLKML